MRRNLPFLAQEFGQYSSSSGNLGATGRARAVALHSGRQTNTLNKKQDYTPRTKPARNWSKRAQLRPNLARNWPKRTHAWPKLEGEVGRTGGGRNFGPESDDLGQSWPNTAKVPSNFGPNWSDFAAGARKMLKQKCPHEFVFEHVSSLFLRREC